MDSRDLKEMLEASLARMIDFVKTADSKIPFILTFEIAMLGFLIASIKNIGSYSTCIILIGIITIAILIGSLFMLALSVFPRTKGPSKSNIYFEKIKCRTFIEYYKELKELNYDDYITDLAEQCHRNAELASLKFKYIKISIILLFLSILPWLFLIFALRYWGGDVI